MTNLGNNQKKKKSLLAGGLPLLKAGKGHHKIKMQNLTVLVGKNNEGKSNILSALSVAMNSVILHSRGINSTYVRPDRQLRFDWRRDFPIQLQDRRNGVESIFRLNFRLEGNELT